ncbi:MAG: hypothetical protein Q9167_002900 [Letrouitia subvulpina]
MALPALLTRRDDSANSSKAFTFPPSQNWDGNDGAWSTFLIGIGTPAQYFRILPSINGQETWVPIASNCTQGPSWCGNARGVEPFKDPSTATIPSVRDAGSTCSLNKSPMCIDNCASVEGKCTIGVCATQYCCGGQPGACNSGGCNGVSGFCTDAYIGCPCTGEDYDVGTNKAKSPGASDPIAATGFLANQSSTWAQLGSYSLSDANRLGVSEKVPYGMDSITIGPNPSNGLFLDNRTVVAGIRTEPLYIGLLGLKPLNNSRFDQAAPSIMQLLYSKNLIPSLSFGYTAGAKYHEPSVLGSFTLGGYDSSRFLPNNVSFALGGRDGRSLEMNLETISTSKPLAGNGTLLAQKISAMIDTDLPYLSLPQSACQRFEQAFGLRWDPSTKVYLVNDTVHGQLRKLNPSLSFTLSQSAAGSVNITLPYLAFDLQGIRPWFVNGTNYFPLRRSSNDSEYAVGRAFLQEAYIFVDYEKSNFTVSQAVLDTNHPNIVTVDHSIMTNPPGLPNPDNVNSLSPGTIAGIAIGSSLALIFIIAALIFLFRRRHNQRRQATEKGHPSISGPIPYSPHGKGSWPSSPTSSGWQDQNSPSTGEYHSTSPIQRLEERLDRLERKTSVQNPSSRNAQTAYEIMEGKEPRPPPMQKWKQELPGSGPTLYELASDEKKSSRYRR